VLTSDLRDVPTTSACGASPPATAEFATTQATCSTHPTPGESGAEQGLSREQRRVARGVRVSLKQAALRRDRRRIAPDASAVLGSIGASLVRSAERRRDLERHRELGVRVVVVHE
jgi:hypothetical protein